VGTRVRIPYQHNHTVASWNEICICAVNRFGFPGDKYQTHATEDYMDFNFKDEKDAILFELTCG